MARTILAKGQSVTIGEGTNDIFGTAAGAERVTILDNTIATFGANFNAGGDTIRLTGLATDFTIRQSGSFAVLRSTDDGIVVNIPIGNVGITIAFETAPNVYGDTRILLNNGTNTVIDGQIVTGVETALNPDAPAAAFAVESAIDSASESGDGAVAKTAPAFAIFEDVQASSEFRHVDAGMFAHSGADSGLMNFIVNFA